MFLLFPGQGAQYPGMALDLLEPAIPSEAGEKIKHLFSIASRITGNDMAELLRSSSPQVLQQTEISQPAITLANLAAAAYLKLKLREEPLKIQPGSLEVPITVSGFSGCAGFSLGEYAALATAGIITEEECFLLVNERGKAMQKVVDRMYEEQGAAVPGMAAVIGLAPEKVEALINEWKSDDAASLKDIYVANINSPEQTVVSGTAKALAAAEDRFIASGARRFIRLRVAGPFHSPLMKEAAEIFAPFLEKVRFRDPAIPVFSNVTGRQISSGEEAKALALRQITEGVRWTDEEKAIACLRPELLLETGPGNVLQGLWKISGSSIPCYAAGTRADIDKLFQTNGD